MRKKAVSGIMLILLLMGMLRLAFNDPVRAKGPRAQLRFRQSNVECMLFCVL